MGGGLKGFLIKAGSSGSDISVVEGKLGRGATFEMQIMDLFI